MRSMNYRFFLQLLLLLSSFTQIAAASEPWKSEFDSISDYSAEAYRVGKTYRVNVSELRPTQLVVGRAEIERRREEISEMTKKELRKYLKKKTGEVVIGPGEEFWLIDGHHLATALLLEGKEEMLVTVKNDWHTLSQEEFFRRMLRYKKMYLYDEKGKGPLDPSKLPKSLRSLRDDPFRSLAWRVRKAGGYENSDIPFAEFEWAHFFRAKFSLTELKRTPLKVLEEALKLARTAEAKDLPGFIGRASRCSTLLRRNN